MKIGFLLSNLGATQSAFRIIYNTNIICSKRYDVDIVVFYENAMKACYATNFATTNIVDAWSYPGNIISTNLNTAYKSLRFPGAKRKYFYVVDLEWINIPNKQYEKLAEIYQSQSIQLITRSQEYANRIEEAWARPVRGIVREFNIDEFIKIISEDENDTGTNKRIL